MALPGGIADIGVCWISNLRIKPGTPINPIKEKFSFICSTTAVQATAGPSATQDLIPKVQGCGMLWLGGLRVTLEGILDWQVFVGKYRKYMGIVWELTSCIEIMINHYHKDPVHNHIKVNKKISSSLVAFFRDENYSIDFFRENESKGNLCTLRIQ